MMCAIHIDLVLIVIIICVTIGETTRIKYKGLLAIEKMRWLEEEEDEEEDR